jgi:hypothetical protein
MKRGASFSEETPMQLGCTTVHENGRDWLFSEREMGSYKHLSLLSITEVAMMSSNQVVIPTL